MPLFVGIHDIHEESCEYFDNHELKDVFFAPIREVFCFFPMCELIGFLAITDGPEMMNFFFMLNHDSVYLLVFHHILLKMRITFSRL